jgi:dolichyl-phosphate-mannose-protein mannosyltransferase
LRSAQIGGDARPARSLAALWGFVAVVLLGWAALTGPSPGQHPVAGAREFGVLSHRPSAGVLTLWVRWDAPSGEAAWVALEPGSPWPDGVDAYWRRRVHPGWNTFIWDDFSGFPPGRPVTLRVLEGQGRWSVARPDTSALYTPAHLQPFAGLLAALVLAGGAAAVLVWRARSSMRFAPRPWHLVLAAAAVLALGLRAHTLTTQSLWFDEVLTAVGAQSFGWVLYSAHIFGHPPLQYLVGWAVGGAQATEGWLRGPFVAAGVAAVVGTGYFGRRLCGTSTGLLAAALLAISPFHVELSQLARPYALLVLAVAVSWLTLFRGLERGAVADWVCFSAVTALAMYTHYSAGFVVLAEALVAATWIARRRGDNGLRALLSFSGIAVLFAPWVPVLTRLVGGPRGSGPASTPAFRDLFTGALIPQLIGSGLGGAVVGALILLGLWKLRSRPEIALAAISSLALPLLLWPAHAKHFLAGRHFAFVLPVLALVVAHGLVTAAWTLGNALARVLGPRYERTRRVGAALTATVLILLGYLPASANLEGYYRWRQGTDWRTVATVLDRAVTPGDAVVGTLGAVYPLRYYWSGLVTQIDGRMLSERYHHGPPGQRLWIITLEGWDWQPELHQWLAAHAVQVGEVPPSWSLPRVYIHRAQGALR